MCLWEKGSLWGIKLPRTAAVVAKPRTCPLGHVGTSLTHALAATAPSLCPGRPSNALPKAGHIRLALDKPTPALSMVTSFRGITRLALMPGHFYHLSKCLLTFL